MIREEMLLAVDVTWSGLEDVLTELNTNQPDPRVVRVQKEGKQPQILYCRQCGEKLEVEEDETCIVVKCKSCGTISHKDKEVSE